MLLKFSLTYTPSYIRNVRILGSNLDLKNNSSTKEKIRQDEGLARPNPSNFKAHEIRVGLN